tara:strand:- start:455 stop:664 length:210 start_codon:yes stop_codon:yes gene_type:complete
MRDYIIKIKCFWSLLVNKKKHCVGPAFEKFPLDYYKLMLRVLTGITWKFENEKYDYDRHTDTWTKKGEK